MRVNRSKRELIGAIEVNGSTFLVNGFKLGVNWSILEKREQM
jgi:hypothetical protein